MTCLSDATKPRRKYSKLKPDVIRTVLELNKDFTIRDVKHLGTPRAVSMCLITLCRNGMLEKVGQLYVMGGYATVYRATNKLRPGSSIECAIETWKQVIPELFTIPQIHGTLRTIRNLSH